MGCPPWLRRIEDRVLETMRRVDGNNVAVHVGLTVGRALPDHGRAGLPIAFYTAAEHVLLDKFGISEDRPKGFNGASTSIDLRISNSVMSVSPRGQY